ncbi:hypothetical protein Syun_008016 [Stephania yunnanensis]|uniref:Transmembrane protein n=1 Tax=Stephania yunnanensis TaxID=152371 RepID=A0AAP0L0L3_9MAGN
MPVTHADLAPGPRCSDIGSKTGAFLMVLSILCGLSCFILSLIAEALRSEATWVVWSVNGKEDRSQCVYNSSGKIPLLCACGAFLSLAIAMVMEHAYMLVAVSQAKPPALLAWNPDESPYSKSLAWQAGFFFFTTWICFAAGEMLLMIGIGVESGHLRKWWKPRTSCLVTRPGIFLAAGVFGLTTVFLASGLYMTALRAQRLSQEQDEARRETWDTSVLYASPLRSPRQHNIANIDDSTLTSTRARQEHSNLQTSMRGSLSLNKLMSSSSESCNVRI